MAIKKEVNKFIKSQQSLQFYKKTQRAFVDVFLALPDKDYRIATKNLIIVALHEGVLGQMMHFSNFNGKFKVMQLTIPQNIPISVLRFVIAHEVGHAIQGRNWKKKDAKKLEINADKYAEKWGFIRTKLVDKYIKKHWKNPRC
jgi:hypothetical protein